MALRYGVDAVAGHNQAVAYGDGFERGGVRFSFHPAGHVIGSAQIAMEYRGERIVVTGDYKRRPAPTCAPFDIVPCAIFITEATFGLPVFRHPPTRAQLAQLLPAVHAEPARILLLGPYSHGQPPR